MRLLALASATILMAGAAHAADLPTIPAPPIAAPVSGYNWSGVYVGLEGGYSWGRAATHYDEAGFDTVPIGTMSPEGWLGGATVGFNYEFSNGFVAGVEGDVSAADISDTVPDLTGGPDDTLTGKTDVTGSIRGRLGYAAGRTLFYGTGGLALAHSKVSATDGNLSDSATLTGWTAGGGIEQAVTQKISLKAEYLYSSFGNHTWFEGEPWQSTGDSSSSTVRVGLNLHF